MRHFTKITDVQDKLIEASNLEIKEMKIVNDSGEPIIYSVDTLYKLGRRYSMAILENTETNKKVLVNERSLRDLINKGYINNAILNNLGAIQEHYNRIKAEKIHGFDTVTIRLDKPDEITKITDELANEYVFILDVDDDIKNISEQRLIPKQFIFDLSGNLIAIHVANEFEDFTVDINTYNKFTSAAYNSGRFSPRSLSQNFSRALDYILIDKKYLDDIKNTNMVNEDLFEGLYEGDKSTKYKKNIRELTARLASVLYGDANVFYAIPKPEKFDEIRFFENAMYDANYMHSTYYTPLKYELLRYDADIPLNSIIALLLTKYNELNTGEYIEKYPNIADYVMRNITRFSGSKEDYIIQELLKVKNLYKNGEDYVSAFKELNLQTIDASMEELGFDEITNMTYELMSGNGAGVLNSKYVKYLRPASITEAFDIFGISFDIEDTKAENAEEKIEDNHKEIEITQQKTEHIQKEENKEVVKNIGVAYLTSNGSVRIELRLSDKYINAYVVNDNTEDDFMLQNSTIKFSDYINYGIDVDKLKLPIKRVLRSISSDISLDSILEEISQL